MKKLYPSTLLLVLFLSVINIYSQDLTPDQIYEKSAGAVVVVYTYDFSGKYNSQGSGIILNEKGIIATNFHVFAGCEKIEVRDKDSMLIELDGILGMNIEKDILILRLKENKYSNIPVTQSGQLKIGQKVYAIGSPKGFQNTISEGIISGLRKIGKLNNDYIQITAPLSPGSSGGAVFNSQGELIGMSCMGVKGGENLNFAIPVQEILKVNSGAYMDKKSLEALTNFFKGYNEYESGQYEEALEHYNKYIEVFLNEAKAYNFRGLAYAELTRYKEAIQDYTKAISIDQTFIAPYMNRADLYYKQEEFDKSIKDYTKVIKIDGKNFNAYNGRGLAHSKNSDWRESIKDFTKVIELEPNYEYAYINRGFSNFELEDYEKAINDWLHAIKINPNYEKDLRPYINYADALRLAKIQN
jgi:tetratricopeptide (TPR) repeat protein